MVTPSCDRMKPSRDVCTPRALPDQWMTRYFPTSTNKTDRGYLHSEIAVNSVRGSSTVTGSHEGEEARGASLFFRLSPDGRISHVKTAPPAAQGRPIENERTAMVRICRPGLRHPFLPRRR